MKDEKISFKSYAWSLGTTSFRTKNFNYVIETQLSLLDEFWKKPENINQSWSSNEILQEKYYDFMKDKKFITGEAKRKAKDSREKTSGLVSLGLIDTERRLTEVGHQLLDISNNNDFYSDNEFLLPKDSYIYFKQLLKTSVSINNDIVKPFIILIKFLSEFDYLTKDEFTYLLPLCINKDITTKIIDDLQDIRNNVLNKSINNTIVDIFIGVIWYKISERKGKILDYMHLSLEADLLPKTHASGGEVDIEYYYDKCTDYPEHYLLIEVTLADGTNQRRMEMEPVSRHLGEHILKHRNKSSYCIFGTTYLDRNVISDFRNRKTYQYYNKDCSEMVDGLKIIPLQTKELKTILHNKLTYKQLYTIFDNAFKSDETIPNWYEKTIINTIGA